MKRTKRHHPLFSLFRNPALPALALLICSLILPGIVPRGAEAAGLLKSKTGRGDVVIRSHQVDVTINNGFARTEVDQTFANTGDQDQEAVYTFPLPKRASLSELSLWIDGHEVVGEVVEKERARQIYEEQRDQGNDTALAEKDDYKTFDISVGRVPARSETRVRLVYYQPVKIEQNIGRYLYPLAEGNVDDVRTAFWSVDGRVDGAFGFNLTLKSAFPVKDVRMPGYQNEAVISKAGDDEAGGGGDVYKVSLAGKETGELSRDIVFYYRLEDKTPARLELVPYKANSGDPGTFMVVVTPAADLKPITEGTDWIFVLDTSGSMRGHKISTLADGVSQVLGKMNPNDRFRIVTFNKSASDFTGGFVQATEGKVGEWIGRVKNLQAGGSTALFAGLKLAYEGLDADRTTGVILVTDGVANVGPTAHSDFLGLFGRYDIRLFTFVIGNSANQPLLERLAGDSGGFAMNISDADDIIGRILQAKAKVMNECMHDVELSFNGAGVRDITPAFTGNLYLGKQLVVFGRYDRPGRVEVELKARISGEKRSWKTTALLPETDADNPELERLWALSAIEDLMETIREKGETRELRSRVAALGTGYSLVTDYTSMLVLREDAYENQGIADGNAKRVERERQAQVRRASAPPRNNRVDNMQGSGSGSGGIFKGLPSPGFGSGPVGPLMVSVLFWINRRRRSAR